MSEIFKALLRAPKWNKKTLAAVAAVLLLLLAYGAGIVVLPLSILSSYHDRNCDFAFSLNKFYMKIYPDLFRDETTVKPIKECEAYGLAVSNEKRGAWLEAYQAYQTYLNTYPSGLYVMEAHGQSAVVLMSLAQDQVEQEKYPEALENLNRIVSHYSDTVTSAEALALIPSTYTSWSADLRAAGDFVGAERVGQDFKAWAQHNQKPELEADIQGELAQTYLAWGLALQSQARYEEALPKFNLAMSADPEPFLEAGPAALAKTGWVKTHIQWGDDLVGKAEFAAAIEKFETAVSRADAGLLNEAKDALSNGYIQWAQHMSDAEDFRGALEQIELAQASAGTDGLKASAETVMEKIYLDFSKSTGTQARQAMREALTAVCEQNRAPDLPIFGLNSDVVRAGLHGIEVALPENLAANTPGEMHYIVCVEVESRIIDRRTLFRRVIFRNSWRIERYPMQRIQYFWNVSLWTAATGELYREQVFAGSMPPSFPDKVSEVGDGRFHGKPPEIFTLFQWLEAILK